MVRTTPRRKVIKALAKGQITIPNEFRQALGIDADTLLTIALVGDHLEMTPLHRGEDALRRYAEEEIARFLEEDKLDQETAGRVRELLRRGEV